jgi:hypothetical protein
MSLSKRSTAVPAVALSYGYRQTTPSVPAPYNEKPVTKQSASSYAVDASPPPLSYSTGPLGGAASYHYGQTPSAGHSYGQTTPANAGYYQYAPSSAEVDRANALIRVLEKRNVLTPFKPKMARWTHDSGLKATKAQQTPKSLSSPNPAPVSKSTMARYVWSCARTYGDDSKGKAELGKHLDKHTSHKVRGRGMPL